MTTIHEQVGYHLKRAQHALRLAMDEALRPIGLTTPQYAALSILEDSPGLSGAALARRCFVTPQTMNAIVIQIETRGLVERRPHPQHGRILQASLTVAGQQQVMTAHQTVRRIEERMVAQLSTAERRQFMQWLQLCSQALEEDAQAGE